MADINHDPHQFVVIKPFYRLFFLSIFSGELLFVMLWMPAVLWVSEEGGQAAAGLNWVLVTVCLWQLHLAVFREWLGESRAASCTVYTRSLELKVTHFAFPYQQLTLIALNSTDWRSPVCIPRLHSSLLERMDHMTGQGSHLTSITTMSWGGM